MCLPPTRLNEKHFRTTFGWTFFFYIKIEYKKLTRVFFGSVFGSMDFFIVIVEFPLGEVQSGDAQKVDEVGIWIFCRFFRTFLFVTLKEGNRLLFTLFLNISQIIDGKQNLLTEIVLISANSSRYFLKFLWFPPFILFII
jgi:hypothetical protein